MLTIIDLYRLWMLKNTVLEFFKRLSGLTWSKSYQNGVIAVRGVLIATFIAVVISDLVECRPFNHYWQVFPDPGGQCRQGYANLITTGVCNVLTDLLLVVLPVPIIIMSQMSFTRKLQLVLLFSMSLLVVAVTLYRIPKVVDSHGSQRLRSLLASIELLIATGVANALVLGSFVRDRGVKKRRFKYGSVAGESVHATDSGNRSRRPTVAERAWGSDEDLVRDVGFGLNKNLRSNESDAEARLQLPAGPVAPIKTFDIHNWNFPERGSSRAGEGGLAPDDLPNSPNSSGPRRVAFFDVGGLLDDQASASPSTARRHSTISSREQLTPHGPPERAMHASTGGFRKGSQAILQDWSGFLGPFRSSRDQSRSRDKERDGSGSSGTELRDLSPAISPRTEAPPPLENQSSEPPAYESSTRTSTSTSNDRGRAI